ncbi:MAG: type II toxin-antitoxin system RelB/DinJ family antitoxin [Butyricicoccus sp.]
MAMDATLQIRIDSAVKEQVEALYRSMGTSFAEAVRMFAQQSLQEGGTCHFSRRFVHGMI